MIALRPFNALMILLAGVAAGLVDGVIAATTPTGRAISINPRRRVFCNHADTASSLQIAQQPESLAMVLANLVVDIADACIGDREFGKFAVSRRLDDRPTSSSHHLVDLCLIVGIRHILCSASTLNKRGYDRRRCTQTS